MKIQHRVKDRIFPRVFISKYGSFLKLVYCVHELLFQEGETDALVEVFLAVVSLLVEKLVAEAQVAHQVQTVLDG